MTFEKTETQLFKYGVQVYSINPNTEPKTFLLSFIAPEPTTPRFISAVYHKLTTDFVFGYRDFDELDYILVKDGDRYYKIDFGAHWRSQPIEGDDLDERIRLLHERLLKNENGGHAKGAGRQ